MEQQCVKLEEEHSLHLALSHEMLLMWWILLLSSSLWGDMIVSSTPDSNLLWRRAVLRRLLMCLPGPLLMAGKVTTNSLLDLSCMRFLIRSKADSARSEHLFFICTTFCHSNTFTLSAMRINTYWILSPSATISSFFLKLTVEATLLMMTHWDAWIKG